MNVISSVICYLKVNGVLGYLGVNAVLGYLKVNAVPDQSFGSLILSQTNELQYQYQFY